MSLFDLVTEHTAQTRQERLNGYYRLLLTADIANPSPTDAAKLAEYLTALRKSASDAQGDWKPRTGSEDLRYGIGGDRSADGKVSDLDAAYYAACAVRQQGIRKLNEEVTAALLAREDAQAVCDRRREAASFLRQFGEADRPYMRR